MTEETSTWASAIVRTMGRIIGCITKFLSSAQRGGSTCTINQEKKIKNKKKIIQFSKFDKTSW